MTIQNQTQKTQIATSVIIPTSLLDQSLGLLRYKTPTAMLLKTRWGIHTFAMQYAIDVLILDKTNKVAALKEALKPNHMYVWNPKYATVLELPAGTIKKTQTEIGDKIYLL